MTVLLTERQFEIVFSHLIKRIEKLEKENKALSVLANRAEDYRKEIKSLKRKQIK